MCIHVHTHTHTHTYTHVNTHTHIHVYTYAYAYMYMHTHIYISIALALFLFLFLFLFRFLSFHLSLSLSLSHSLSHSFPSEMKCRTHPPVTAITSEPPCYFCSIFFCWRKPARAGRRGHRGVKKKRRSNVVTHPLVSCRACRDAGGSTCAVRVEAALDLEALAKRASGGAGV